MNSDLESLLEELEAIALDCQQLNRRLGRTVERFAAEFPRNTLLADIEEFMEQRQIGISQFGIAAMGDKHFITELRKGRRVWPETEEKVRAFMASQPKFKRRGRRPGNG